MNCSLRRSSRTKVGFERQAEFEVHSKDNAQIGVPMIFYFKSLQVIRLHWIWPISFAKCPYYG